MEKQDNDTQNEATRKLLEETQEELFPYFYEYDGMRIRVDKNVFSPKYFDGWRIFNDNFPDFLGKVVLEIGTATGITSLFLAKNGAAKVVGVDINENAVINAKANVKKNKISNIEIRHSDMFSSIKENEKFDIIYWNMPFGYIDHDYEYNNVLERAIFDPGYEILRRLLDESSRHLRKDGFLLIGTGSGGNIDKFKRISKEKGYHVELLAKVDAEEVYPVDFQLYKLVKQ